jgi:hypothetical protein
MVLLFHNQQTVTVIMVMKTAVLSNVFIHLTTSFKCQKKKNQPKSTKQSSLKNERWGKLKNKKIKKKRRMTEMTRTRGKRTIQIPSSDTMSMKIRRERMNRKSCFYSISALTLSIFHSVYIGEAFTI